MTAEAPTLIDRTERDIACAEPLITFPTTGGDSWPVWYRFLALRGQPVFEIGNICSTCEYWFKRLPGAADAVDVETVQEALTRGLSGVEGFEVDAFASLLQAGLYRVALFSLVPERVEPGSSHDYFANEQRATWIDIADEPPTDPAISYYRVSGRSGASTDKEDDPVFEFIAPLQVVADLAPERIAFFQDWFGKGAQPTAVAVATLDIKQSYDSEVAHWCLTHFLLDGHHKVEAAAQARRPIRLLSFISPTGISAPEQVDSLLDHYGSERPSISKLRRTREAVTRNTSP